MVGPLQTQVGNQLEEKHFSVRTRFSCLETTDMNTSFATARLINFVEFLLTLNLLMCKMEMAIISLIGGVVRNKRNKLSQSLVLKSKINQQI